MGGQENGLALLARQPDDLPPHVSADLRIESGRGLVQLMGPMGEAGAPKVARYSDKELELLVDYQRFSRELQEDHAEWLRKRLAERDATAP
jgi:hypothetical protein